MAWEIAVNHQNVNCTWWSRSVYVINYFQYQDETKDYFNLNIKLFNACVGKESDSKIITIANQIVYFQIPHKDDESIHIKPQLFLQPTFLV